VFRDSAAIAQSELECGARPGSFGGAPGAPPSACASAPPAGADEGATRADGEDADEGDGDGAEDGGDDDDDDGDDDDDDALAPGLFLDGASFIGALHDEAEAAV